MTQAHSFDSSPLMESAWMDVLHKMDATYAELLTYQVELEQKNSDLEQMRQFVDSVLGAITDILIVCDKSGHVLQVNQAVLRHLNAGLSDVIGRAITDFFCPKSQSNLRDLIAQGKDSSGRDARELCLISGGEEAPFEVHATPRLDTRGRMVGTVLIGRPVGEMRKAYQSLNETHEQLKSAQAQLIRAEKMASLGRLVSGVAHELNNPISFVYGNAHALERYVGRLEAYFEMVKSGASREELIALREKLKIDTAVKRLSEAVSGALEGAERVRDIVDSLRRFSATGHGDFEPFDLVASVQTAIAWVVKGRGQEFRLNVEAPTSLWVKGRSGHIQQVVMNIVQNACDAIEGQASQRLNVSLSQVDDYAVVQVTDNGPGISDEALPNLFEPFFTTKPVGKGTGLGLSISYKIIEEHGGQFRALNLEHIPKSVQRFSEKNVRQNKELEQIQEATPSEFALIGACFEFTLPVDGPQKGQEAP